MKPLSGVRVAEFGHFIAAPHACQILADHGADVIKVEPPGGENTRFVPPHHEGISIYFAAHNRDKRSLAIDLKRPEARPILHRLLEWADILVTNYTPATAVRLGLDHPAASLINPRIIVVQISGFGAVGAYRELGGVDGTIQARSGIADLTGEADGPPIVGQVQAIDHMTAVQSALGAVMALRARELTGQGQLVDVAMMDVAVGILAHQIGDVALNGAPARRNGSAPPYALANAYEAADGYVFLAPMSLEMWRGVCEVIGRPDLAADNSPYREAAARLRDRAVLEGMVNDWTKGHRRAEIVAAMTARGVSSSAISTVAEAIIDPSVVARGMVRQVEAGDSGRKVPAPGTELKIGEWSARPAGGRIHELGEDSRGILADLGISPDEIAGLLDARVVLARS